MALQTLGFRNAGERNRHFQSHGMEFGASNPVEYEELADQFIVGPLLGGIRECRRKKGDTLRFDPSSKIYGVLDKDGVIRTFFKPVPCVEILNQFREALRKAGKCHSFQCNLSYFESECKKW